MPEDPVSPDSLPQRTTGGPVRWEPPSPAELEAQMPGYTIEKILGRGGMGAVYRGVQTNLDRTVAIKILPPGVEQEDPSFAERFKNEAKLMAKLNHPAVVAVHDFGTTTGGLLYFAMEYVDGTDVSQMIRSQKQLPPEHALAITAHVCDALAAAHELGIVHRDIKPANVLINMKGQVKVADFGLAKVEEPGSHGLTKTGYAMGTPDFVAPEVLMLGANIDGRADLYAVGVMLYQMLTGEVPRGAFKPATARVPGLDPRFDPIILKAMQSDREERYQSSAELRRDLDVILTVPLVRQDDPPSAAIPAAQVAQTPAQRSAAQKPMARSAGAPTRQPEVNAGEGTRAPVSPKSKAPLILGLAAAAAMGIGAFIMFGGDKVAPGKVATSPPSPSVAPAKNTTPPSPPATDKPLPATKSKPSASIVDSTGTAAMTSGKNDSPSSKAEASPTTTADTVRIPADAQAFGGHRYAKTKNILSYDDAREKARSMGGDLASITTAEEQNWVIKTFMGGGTYAVWIGGYRDQAGAWKWVSGEPWSFTAWATHPDGKREALRKENYLMLWSQSKLEGWRAVDRKTAAYFIVEWDGDTASTSTLASASKPAETVRPTIPAPNPTTSTPARAEPPVVPAWLVEARKLGGRARFFGGAPGGATQLGRVAEFTDVVTTMLGRHGMLVHRRGGDAHGVMWHCFSQPSRPPDPRFPDGGMPFGPLSVSRVSRGAMPAMLDSKDGSYHGLWGTSAPQHSSKAAHPQVASYLHSDNITLALDSRGKLLATEVNAPDRTAPPEDFFLDATAMTATGNAFQAARPGLPVRSSGIAGHNSGVTDFPNGIRDVIEMDAGDYGGNGVVILLNKSGQVFVTSGDGNAASGAMGKIPANLGAAIAVRAGRGMCAAQMTDGTWVAWGESPELIAQTKKIGPALDVDYDFEPAVNSNCMLWIDAATTAPLATNAPSGQTPAPSAANDLYARLGQIATQFQTAYDRDIAPGHNAAVADLDTKYLAAVNRALGAATKKGVLEEALKLREEVQRVNQNGRLPTAELDSLPESLKKLRGTYRSALAKLEQDRDIKAKPYYDRYDELLATYQTELTQQKRLDDALKVKARRDDLEKSRQASIPAVADASDGSPLGPVKAVNSTTEPSKQVRVPKNTTTKSIIEWVLGVGGSVDVRSGGQKQVIRDMASLPKVPFEVVNVRVGATLKADVTDEMFAMLSIVPSLEEVYATGQRMRVTSLAPLANLTKLKSIIVICKDGDELAEKELRHLAGLPLLETLKVNLKDRTGEGCEALRGLTNLRDLSLSGPGRLSAKGAEAIATLTTLTSLELSALDRASQSRFGPVATLPNLEELSLTNAITPTSEFLGFIARSPKLKRLSITGSVAFDPKSFAALKPADGRLVTLYFGYGDKLTDDSVREIVAALPGLESFRRTETGESCTSKSLLELAKLQKLTELGWARPTDVDCKLLTGFPLLEDLTLQGKEVTDAVFAHLKNIPKLKRVTFRYSSVTQGGVDQFKIDRPGVVVYQP